MNTTSIDVYCKDHSISRIDILKLDIQGAELLALQGALEMLKNHKISVIYTEIILVQAYQGQYKLSEYLKFMEKANYVFCGFFDPVYIGSQLFQADCIFAVPDL